MITLAQISVGRVLDFWVNYRPGIYYYNFDGNYSFIDSSLLVNVPTVPGITSIGSAFYDNNMLTQVFSISDLDNSPSFYYNSTENGIYIRLANYDPPDIYTITVGPSYSISDEPYVDPITSTVYQNRLLTAVNATREKDKLFFGKITYSPFSIEINNADGALYDIQNWDVYGQPLKILYGESTDSAASFDVVRTGTVKNYRFSGDRLIIEAQDSRRVLTKTLPVNNVDTKTYPNADRDKNKSIPVVYGACRRVPCRVLDDATATTTFTFSCADCLDHALGIKAISAVYVQGVSVSIASTNLLTGQFTLSSSVYTKGNTVTADVEGYVDSGGNTIQNPLDVLKDIINVYLEYPYNSNFFDTVTWDNSTLNQPNVNYAVTQKTKVTQIAEDIGASLLEGLYINPENKFTWLSHKDSDPPLFQIKAIDWLGIPKIEFNSEEAVSTATVSYNRNWNTGDFNYVDYRANFDAFVQKFKAPQDQEFKTVLVTDANAASYAEEIGDAYQDVQIYIEGSIDLSLTNPSYMTSLFAIQPGDNVDAEVKDIEIANGKIRYEQDIIGRFKAEVIRLVISPQARTAAFRLRYIEIYDTVLVDGGVIGDMVMGYDYLGNAGFQNV